MDAKVFVRLGMPPDKGCFTSHSGKGMHDIIITSLFYAFKKNFCTRQKKYILHEKYKLVSPSFCQVAVSCSETVEYCVVLLTCWRVLSGDWPSNANQVM